MGDTVVVERVIAADPAILRDLVSDVTRMGEWSPENTGARWLEGRTSRQRGQPIREYESKWLEVLEDGRDGDPVGA